MNPPIAKLKTYTLIETVTIHQVFNGMKNGLYGMFQLTIMAQTSNFLTDFESKPVPEKCITLLGSYLMRIDFSDEAYFFDIDDARVARESESKIALKNTVM